MEDKVACVTGAASGIGRAAAQLLAREGALVIATDVAAEAAPALLQEIDNGRDHAFLALDVSDEHAWMDVELHIRERFRRLDILVNNAGVAMRPTPVTDVSLASWRSMMSINLDGVFLGTKHLLPLMRESGGGSIVNVSSIAGIRPSANASAYAASKGAVRLFTKAVALECAAAKGGVRVNSLHPGMIETAIWDDIIGRAEGGGTGSAQTSALTALTANSVPMARAGQVEEIAAGILWLASDESSYMTGGELVIDGGCTIR